MSKNTRSTRSNRRQSKPNVFVQSHDSDDQDNSVSVSPAASSPEVAPRTRARVQRTTQRASIRSEIFTRTLSAELKKMGALSGVLIIALIVLTFAL